MVFVAHNPLGQGCNFERATEPHDLWVLTLTKYPIRRGVAYDVRPDADLIFTIVRSSEGQKMTKGFLLTLRIGATAQPRLGQNSCRSRLRY